MVYIIAEEAYVGRRAGGVGQTGVPIAHLEYFCDSEMRPIWRLYDTAGAIGAGRKSPCIGYKIISGGTGSQTRRLHHVYGVGNRLRR